MLIITKNVHLCVVDQDYTQLFNKLVIYRHNVLTLQNLQQNSMKETHKIPIYTFSI